MPRVAPSLSVDLPSPTEVFFGPDRGRKESIRLPSFAELNLLPELLKAVAEQGYVEPTPIQVQAIPLVLQGRRLMALLPKQRQTLLFSATLSADIRTLADSFLHDPVLVQVARLNTAAELVQHVAHPVRRERKRELLAYLVQSRDLRQVLVFTSTRIGANRLAYQLNRDGIHTSAIHGDKSQPERLQALADFKSGKVRVLVATDVAARGLDIEDLPHVVNF